MRNSKRKIMMTFFAAALVLLFMGCVKTTSETSSQSETTSSAKTTLEQIQERGKVVVGVSSGVPGYSAPDSEGLWTGFDVDIARAVSAAIFGDPDKIECRPLTAAERFTALQSGEIDLLSRVTTWTSTRDTTLGLSFAGVNYYDGQGFMVSNESGITNINELDHATIAVQSGTTTEMNLADYFRKNGLDYELITFDTNDQAANALESGRADAVTSDQSQLYALRSNFTNPENFNMLPELISKEPLGPVVREGDDQWFNIVRWALFVMINAEEYGVTSANVDELKTTTDNPNIKRLLGVEGDFGTGMGLTKDFGYNIIKLVGNYGESFDRNLGAGSPLNIGRGFNALWNDGGLQYGYPIR